jgi:hypothetical protein
MITVRFSSGLVLQYPEANDVNANTAGLFIIGASEAREKIAFVPHQAGAIVEYGAVDVNVVPPAPESI